MKQRTFRVTKCDGCEHAFRRSLPEKVFLMAFQPLGADFEVTYALCRKCYRQVPANQDLVERALGHAAARCPEYVAYSQQVMLEHGQPGGAA